MKESDRLQAIAEGLRDLGGGAGAEGDDLVSMLLAAHDESDGTGMTDRQLMDEARTILLAGHETTALALTYALHLLSRHPATQDRLRAELAACGFPTHTGTDTEVILLAYRVWGTAAVERFRGMFAFALADPGRSRVWFVRDRLGIKPLYL